MFVSVRLLLLIGCASALWAFSFGLGSQVVSHWLKAQAISDTIIGWNHSFYYFGLAVGSCAVPALTRRLGASRSAALGMILSGVTLAIFPWGGGVWSWYLLRFCNGWAGAMSLVPLETIVSRDSQPERKTRNFAYYGVSLTVGGALGIALGLHAYEPGGTFAFYLGGLAPLLGGAAVWLGLASRAIDTEEHGPAVSLDVRRNVLSYGTAWYQGFLEGGMLAFLSLFLVSRGFSTDLAGVLMSIMMVGVIVFQVPVSWLADRCGKTPILLGCYAVVAAMLLGIPWLTNSFVLALALFAFGACTGAMYPLGLSRLGDHMAESGLARAYAWYLAIECVGSLIGAAIMGHARDRWGETSMFAVGLAAVVLVPAMWVVLRIRPSAPAVKDDPSRRVPVSAHD